MASDGSSWWSDKIKWLQGVQDLQKLASMSSKDWVRLFPISTTLAAPIRAIRQTIAQRNRNLLFIWPVSKHLEENAALFYEVEAQNRQNGEPAQYSKSVSPGAAIGLGLLGTCRSQSNKSGTIRGNWNRHCCDPFGALFLNSMWKQEGIVSRSWRCLTFTI